ncbi:Protein-L-isoaspartate O-methyltransferase [Thelohanellus kitauei]|uniref:protein-L-isoaspartate(D-aspartate) O-methyltransferase n=1 Tax=Thelohanellus kitauei TaxID=669202 RepID=A0A0C2J4S8_THEKT|nr:Protein-L-isoaspartate O-methyltransferase [Thelohanellus kitauei]KII66833.1 Protein-L-isoaspartate O-methyltransferase [Thelohanellus kitauei]
MKAVDRKYFAPENPYDNYPVGIGLNIPISAPYIVTYSLPKHAHALEIFESRLRNPQCRALDVGSGSGYMTLCMAVINGFKNTVIGIEHFGRIINQSINNISNAGYSPLLESGKIKFIS